MVKPFIRKVLKLFILNLYILAKPFFFFGLYFYLVVKPLLLLG